MYWLTPRLASPTYRLLISSQNRSNQRGAPGWLLGCQNRGLSIRPANGRQASSGLLIICQLGGQLATRSLALVGCRGQTSSTIQTSRDFSRLASLASEASAQMPGRNYLEGCAISQPAGQRPGWPGYYGGIRLEMRPGQRTRDNEDRAGTFACGILNTLASGD